MAKAADATTPTDDTNEQETETPPIDSKYRLILVAAQRSKQPEFTRQGLMITNFVSTPATDLKLGRRAADAVRSRVGKLSNKREVDVIDGGDIRYQLERSSYNADGPLEPDAIHSLGRFLRADEYVNGYVTNTPAGARLTGELVLLRDEHLRQPLRLEARRAAARL